MSLFDNYLNKIGNMITIKDEDREEYTRDFDVIRDYIFDIMRKTSPVFKRICKGHSLFGSYANNVRICYPSEFDVHIRLSFPYSSYMVVKQDPDRPGYVNIDCSAAMVNLKYHNGYEDLYHLLKSFVMRSNGYLRRTKLQNWIQDIFVDALKKYGNEIDGFKLEYSKRSLAHTIYARGRKHNISIDFVPALMFGQEEWMDIRSDHPFTNKCYSWFAVPKSTTGPKNTRKYAFMICNPKVEHDLLLGRQNLKVVFRLLKSLCKSYGLRRLKSYFITTAFLWEIEKQSDNFWNNSISYLFIHMLDVLADYFFFKCLPFFWDDELNLLDILNEYEICDYADKLCGAYNTLDSYENQPHLSFKRCLSHFKVPK